MSVEISVPQSSHPKSEACDDREVRSFAFACLARRSHSVRGLREKMEARFPTLPSEVLDAVLLSLQEEGYLCEWRDLQATVDYGVRQGYGPNRMLWSLQKRGYDRDVILSCLKQVPESDWTEQARCYLEKKYDKPTTFDRAQLAKVQRGLLQRGFLGKQVGVAMRVWLDTVDAI